MVKNVLILTFVVNEMRVIQLLHTHTHKIKDRIGLRIVREVSQCLYKHMYDFTIEVLVLERSLTNNLLLISKKLIFMHS